MTLIAEDLLVLLIHDRGSRKGRLIRPEVPLGAAVLAELAQAGVVDRMPFTLRLGRVVRVIGPAPADPALASAVAVLQRKPLHPPSAARSIGHELLDVLATRLEAEQVLERLEQPGRRGRSTVLWRVVSSDRRTAVLDRVRHVLDPSLPVDPQAAVIAGILVELHRLNRLLGLGWRAAGDAFTRTRRIAHPRWAIDTVAFDESS